MRRVLIWLVMLCLLSGLAWAEQESPTVTVLVYISGSDLEEGDSSASEDIEEMIRADIAPGGPLRVLVQTGGTKAWENEAIPGKKTARFEVNRDGIGLLEQMRSANMGRADTLADFLRFGQATAPADRYILVL